MQFAVPFMRQAIEGAIENNTKMRNYNVEKLCAANPDREFGCTDEQSEENVEDMLNKKYDTVINDESVFTVQLNGKWGFVDLTGKEIISPCYDWMGDEFVENMIIVGYEDKGIGYANREGIEVVKPKYNQAREFDNGFAAVCLGGKWGFVDKSGNEIASTIYDSVENFENGKAEVTLNGDTFFIDTKGVRIDGPMETNVTNDVNLQNTDELWQAVINNLPAHIQSNISAPAGKSYIHIKPQSKHLGVKDFKYCVEYSKTKARAYVNVETLNGGIEGKTAIQQYIDNNSADCIVKNIIPQQGAKNKDKWKWEVTTPANELNAELVQWYVDTIIAFYQFFEV